LDSFAVISKIAPGLAGFDVSNVQMRNRGSGFGRLNRGIRNLTRGNRNSRMFADCVASARNGAADDDFIIHSVI
jgi:hypothetical protein